MKNKQKNICLVKRSSAEPCYVLAGQSCHFFFSHRKLDTVTL